jgi:hypothetical protein
MMTAATDSLVFFGNNDALPPQGCQQMQNATSCDRDVLMLKLKMKMNRSHKAEVWPSHSDILFLIKGTRHYPPFAFSLHSHPASCHDSPRARFLALLPIPSPALGAQPLLLFPQLPASNCAAQSAPAICQHLSCFVSPRAQQLGLQSHVPAFLYCCPAPHASHAHKPITCPPYQPQFLRPSTPPAANMSSRTNRFLRSNPLTS